MGDTLQACHAELAEFKMTNLEKGLTILELLAENPEGLGTSEIARQLDIPKNFIFRAASVLHMRGYLERNDAAKTYSLSRKLLSMGYHVLKHTSLIELAMPVMRDLRNEVKETVTLCAVEGVRGIVLDHVPSPHAMRLVVDSGAHFDLHASAPGKAMLAYYAEADRNHLIKQLLFKRYTDTTITKKTDFLKALELVRSQGYAIDYGEELEGIHCVSAPIIDSTDSVIASLVVTGPTSRFTEPMIPRAGELVRRAAALISTKLGNLD